LFHKKITVETTVTAPIVEVWRAWTTPDDIKNVDAAHNVRARVRELTAKFSLPY
jgi:uncharacterized protein YndB with AHSA1/START domain